MAGGVRRVTVECQKTAILLFRNPRLDLAGPDDLAGFQFETEKVQPQVLLIARLVLIEAVARVGSDEHLVAPSDRARSPGPRQGNLPGHVRDALSNGSALSPRAQRPPNQAREKLGQSAARNVREMSARTKRASFPRLRFTMLPPRSHDQGRCVLCPPLMSGVDCA